MTADQEKKMDKEMAVQTRRGYNIVKSNEIIQRTRYQLSLQQQQILSYMISLVLPSDAEFKSYLFDIKEFCRLCSIDEYNGKNLLNFKTSLQTLADISFWIQEGDKEILMRWFKEVEIDKNQATVRIEIDNRLRPYLLGLKENFTVTSLQSVLAMNSKYTPRFYELLKSYANLGRYEDTLENIKKRLDINTQKAYDNYATFRRRVLDKAVEEVNRFTEIDVSYEPIRCGRNITSLVFYIKKKQGGELIVSHFEARDALDGTHIAEALKD